MNCDSPDLEELADILSDKMLRIRSFCLQTKKGSQERGLERILQSIHSPKLVRISFNFIQY